MNEIYTLRKSAVPYLKAAGYTEIINHSCYLRNHDVLVCPDFKTFICGATVGNLKILQKSINFHSQCFGPKFIYIPKQNRKVL